METPKDTPKDTPKEIKECTHPNTYVAVRHVSGIKLVRCSDCGRSV